MRTLFNTFVPLYITHKNAGGRAKLKLLGQINVPNKYETLLGNFYKVEINLDQLSINVYGFFEYDCVNSNIRTSQIYNKLIYDNFICDSYLLFLYEYVDKQTYMENIIKKLKNSEKLYEMGIFINSEVNTKIIAICKYLMNI